MVLLFHDFTSLKMPLVKCAVPFILFAWEVCYTSCSFHTKLMNLHCYKGAVCLIPLHIGSSYQLTVTRLCRWQKCPNEELSRFCDLLFEQLDQFADNNKRRAAVWPLQIMLLVLCPVSQWVHLYGAAAAGSCLPVRPDQ